MLPSTSVTVSASRTIILSLLNSPTHLYRYRRFACTLTGTCARLTEWRSWLDFRHRGLAPPTLCQFAWRTTVLFTPSDAYACPAGARLVPVWRTRVSEARCETHVIHYANRATCAHHPLRERDHYGADDGSACFPTRGDGPSPGVGRTSLRHDQAVDGARLIPDPPSHGHNTPSSSHQRLQLRVIEVTAVCRQRMWTDGSLKLRDISAHQVG